MKFIETESNQELLNLTGVYIMGFKLLLLKYIFH